MLNPLVPVQGVRRAEPSHDLDAGSAISQFFAILKPLGPFPDLYIQNIAAGGQFFPADDLDRKVGENHERVKILF